VTDGGSVSQSVRHGVEPLGTHDQILVVVETIFFFFFVCRGAFCLARGRVYHVRGPFEKFVDWRPCAAVMQREAETVMLSCSGGGNVVVV
jgi:hypothetical protein